MSLIDGSLQTTFTSRSDTLKFFTVYSGSPTSGSNHFEVHSTSPCILRDRSRIIKKKAEEITL